MRKIKTIIIFITSVLISSAISVPCFAVKNYGFTVKDGAYISVFDSVENICRGVTTAKGFNNGILDKSLKLKFWLESPFIQLKAEDDNCFDIGEYHYLKIKYCALTAQKSAKFSFLTQENGEFAEFRDNQSVTLKLEQQQWKEEIYDISALSKNCEGHISKLRLSFGSIFKAERDVIFIEYIGFFASEADAAAYGGITEEQKNGKDNVSLYVNGKYSRFGTQETVEDVSETAALPAAETDKGSKKSTSFMTYLPYAVIGICVIAVAVVAVGGKRGTKNEE